MTLDSPVGSLKGVGPALEAKFAQLGIMAVADLIDYYPRRYDDYSALSSINMLHPGVVTIQAKITNATGRYVRRGMHITEAIASDDTGSVRLVWFNQPYRANSIKVGVSYYVSGNYELKQQRFSIMNPAVEMASEFPVNTARIIPIYRETKGLGSRQIRDAIKQVMWLIESLPDPLPKAIIAENKLVSYSSAMQTIHFPETSEQLEIARHRLGFEEVFRLSLASLLNKQANQKLVAPPINFEEQLARDFVAELPFKLTDAQKRAIWQIYLDLQKSQPMNRLIEGDVGSGKTVVATMAALMAIKQGWQVALMAPTELLARQHADTIHKLLKPLGMDNIVDFLVGGLSPGQKSKAHASIATGKAQFIIGTQALIQEKVDMHKLALIIVDEQHRFGVEQRKTLMSKAGHMPHVLSLTATPIPRSLALTLYGELDISVIDVKPGGRLPIITKLVSPNSVKPVYDKITQELEAGRQMFVVCPLIKDSEIVVAKSVEKVYEELSKGEFKKWKVALLHGKLKSAEKNQIMTDFVAHKIDILVSTTVIEVGVDVPNASVMMIEGPERFGLAQAHQLRGRVGRSSEQGYCYLMLSDSKAPSRRLRALESSNDGFKLAELDLEIRGPGAIYGTSQSGDLDLRIAKLSDVKLIASARHAAQKIIYDQVNLLQYKQLMAQVTRLQSVTNLN
jgi:ATP-dependent DNA helicase RecG